MPATSADRNAGELDRDVFGGKTYAIAAGESEVIDLRAAGYFVVWAASGTPKRLPCDDSGTALPGAASVDVAVGVLNQRVSHYTKVTAPVGQAATVIVF